MTAKVWLPRKEFLKRRRNAKKEEPAMKLTEVKALIAKPMGISPSHPFIDAMYVALDNADFIAYDDDMGWTLLAVPEDDWLKCFAKAHRSWEKNPENPFCKKKS